MTVYVDWLLFHGWILRGRRIQSCHMMADSERELVTFAQNIGLKPQWLQGGSALHFDLTPNKRKAAVEAGAVELSKLTFRAVYRKAQGQAREKKVGDMMRADKTKRLKIENALRRRQQQADQGMFNDRRVDYDT